MAAKLEKKGVLIKERDERNQSRLQLRLTDRGEQLHRTHELFHQQLDEIIEEALAAASEENKRFLEEFLYKLEHRLLDMYAQ